MEKDMFRSNYLVTLTSDGPAVLLRVGGVSMKAGKTDITVGGYRLQFQSISVKYCPTFSRTGLNQSHPRLKTRRAQISATWYSNPATTRLMNHV